MSTFDERAKDWDSDPAKVERARVVANAIRASIYALKNGEMQWVEVLTRDMSKGGLGFVTAEPLATVNRPAEFVLFTSGETRVGQVLNTPFKFSNFPFYFWAFM